MIQEKQQRLRSRWVGLACLGLVMGCSSTPMPSGAGPQGLAAPAPAAQVEAPTDAWTPANATVTTVAITPEGGDRRVLQSGSWLDRLRGDRTHSVFGGDTLGSGFTSDGLLPFVSTRRTGSSRVSLADLRNNTVYEIPVLSSRARNPVLSRGGRFLAYEEDGDLQILDLRTQLIRDFNSLGSGRRSNDIRDFDIDAFGNVTYIDSNGRVHILDTDSGRDYIVPVAGRGIGNIRDVSISGNGRFVVFTGNDGNGSDIFLTDITSGRQYSIPFINGRGGRFGSRGFGSLRNFELSPNGDQLLFSDGDRVRMLDLRSGFVDNLALLNSGDDIDDARFLDGSGDRIVFERDGRIMVYHRNSNVIDTLPIVNSDRGSNLLGDRSRFSFGRFFR